jgi:hypothetical protein
VVPRFLKVLKSESQQRFDDMLASYMLAEQSVDDIDRDPVIKMAPPNLRSVRDPTTIRKLPASRVRHAELTAM